jgi:S1-C subfamily serine protease
VQEALRHSRMGANVGLWRYVDRGVCYEDEEALVHALAGQGKRNLFHDDQLLVLEHESLPPQQPPLVGRRLILTRARSDWLGGASSSGSDAQRRWRSDPLPLSGDGWPSEADLPAVRAFFSQVHAYLHDHEETDGRPLATEAVSAAPGEDTCTSGAARTLSAPPTSLPAARPILRPTQPKSPSRRRRPVLIALLLGGMLLAVVMSQGFWRASGQSGSSVWLSGASRPSAAEVAALASAVSPGLVYITSSLADQNSQVAGTGVVLSALGEVLTNNHVIDGAGGVSVSDVGNGRSYQAYVVGYDRSLDIAVLQLVDASGLQTIQPGDSSALRIGQGVVAIGNAGGLGGAPIAEAGTIVALDQQVVATNQGNGSSEQLSGLIGVDAAVQPGDSGGPLIDAAGRTIGIDTAASEEFSLSSGSSRGFAIPISQALSIAQKIESGTPSVGVHIGPTAFLGVELALSKSTGARRSGGALVAGVFPTSPAQQVGLGSGDLITSLAGRRVDSGTTLTSILDGCQPGNQVSVNWTDPSGQHRTASVQLGIGPPA